MSDAPKNLAMTIQTHLGADPSRIELQAVLYTMAGVDTLIEILKIAKTDLPQSHEQRDKENSNG